jgi:hypothetical protein
MYDWYTPITAGSDFISSMSLLLIENPLNFEFGNWKFPLDSAALQAQFEFQIISALPYVHPAGDVAFLVPIPIFKGIAVR